jgi:pyruvate dehydrogenase E2 component (dihydrolipoamide acetyltransferase)
MATKVIMPQGGQDIEVGSIVRWLKKEGDPVKKGEVICEVETEKAVFEVEAPEDGFLKKIVVTEGQQTPIFSVIGLIGERDEAIDVDSILAAGKKGETGPDISKVRATLEAIKGRDTERVSITPRAKKLATERGIPISSIKGSGPGGRIKEEDVLQVGQEGPVDRGLSSGEYISGGRKISMTKVRKVIARKMRKSKQVVPHFYVSVSVDMTEALRFLAEFNETLENSGEGLLSVNDLIIRACALCLEEFPQLNSSVLDEENIVYWDDINIGIAVALDSGLVVPVLQNADRLQLLQIGRETRHLVEMARAGKQVSLAPGRFTVSNMGMFHVDNFIAIINYPETAILAIASIEKKVVALDGGSIGLRDMMTITLSVDHQVVDGIFASRFINKVKFHLENPKSLL